MKKSYVQNKSSQVRCIWLLGIILCVMIIFSQDGFSQQDAKKSKERVSYDLLQLNKSYEERGMDVLSEMAEEVRDFLRVYNNRIVIDAVAMRDASVLLADLEALGLEEGKIYGRMISGRLPIEAIDELENLSSLKFVRPAYAETVGDERVKKKALEYANRHAKVTEAISVGLVTSQGDAAMRSDDARATYNVDGSGVTVGVMSDTYDDFDGIPITTAADDIASGDLPPAPNILDDTGGPGIDEGRAMMQLVFDVAPGCDLAFHTAFNGQADFASGIGDLATVAGCDIVVDDIIYFAEPMFQDGIIAQAADAVEMMGVAYFSSAGNNNRDSYESPFVVDGFFQPGGFPVDTSFNPFPVPSFFFGGDAHDFGGGDVFQSITVPEGSGFRISFQWDQPFFSVSAPVGSASDYDIYVFDDPPTTVLGGSVDANFGADAVEVFGFFNPPGSGVNEFNIMIVRYDGPDAGLMKYVRFDLGSGVIINEFDTASPTIYGHANAAGAEAIGAAFYQETPEFGTDPALLEPFSSAGPVPILLDLAGTLLPVPEIRVKPAVVGPDGTNTTFFLPPSDPEGDLFPNFFGTSASAPHAAAVAALMLEADGSLAPADIYNILRATADDMDVPGFDNNTGFGFIQADSAVCTVVPQPTPGKPGVCYATTGGGGQTPGVLLTIDPGSGAGTLVGSTGQPRMPGLAINSSGRLFGSNGGSASELLRIDALSGASFSVGPIVDIASGATLSFVDALASDKNDVLYASDGVDLYTIDTTTAGATLIGNHGLASGFLVGLAFEPGTDRLFGSQGGLGGADEIYEVDPATGLATVIGTTGLGGATPDLHFVCGALYGVKNPGGGQGGAPADLIIIDTNTGVGTVIGSVGFGSVSGLASFAGNPPVCTITPGTSFEIFVGEFLTFDVTATDPDPGDVLTLELFPADVLPPGATMTPAITPPLVGTSPLSSTFEWTPAVGQEGIYIFGYQITDSLCNQTFCKVDITVKLDTIPPLCEVTNIDPGPPFTIEVTIQDNESGVAAINVVFSNNANITIPPFTPGTTDPIIVTAEKIDQTQSATVVLEVVDVAGNTTLCDPVTQRISAVVPQGFALRQNFPNPFNPSTDIHFYIPATNSGAVDVAIKVYDITGREVITLVNKPMEPGRYSVQWDGTNSRGEKVAGGIYVYRMVAGDFVATRKMLLLK